jgi:hypothetical protein
MNDATYPHQPAGSRWLGAPLTDPTQPVALQGTGRLVREVALERVLSQVAQQRVERQACTRYRIHGQLAPLTVSGHGPAVWSQFEQLATQLPSAAGATADFFRDFTYALYVPDRVEPLPGLVNTYQLYYRPVGPAVDVLAGTLARDPWGGVQFPFVVTAPVELDKLVIQGLPVPLPVTEVVVALLGPTGSQRYSWPVDWSESELSPAPATSLGFDPGAVLSAADLVGAALLTELKPADWTGLSDAAFVAVALGALVPVFSAYNIEFTALNVLRNQGFLAAHLSMNGLGRPLVNELTAPDGALVGPRVRYDPLVGELEYLSAPRHGILQQLIIDDTLDNRATLAALGYRHQLTATGLLATFALSWEPLVHLPLQAFAPVVVRADPSIPGAPSWAFTDPVTAELVYRPLLLHGEQQGDRGLDFPHLNGCHYVYQRVGHYVGPELSDYNSFRAFYRVLPTGRLRTSATAFNPNLLA